MVSVLEYDALPLNTRMIRAWQRSWQSLFSYFFLHTLTINPTSFHNSNTQDTPTSVVNVLDLNTP